jgi:hypothetical protein
MNIAKKLFCITLAIGLIGLAWTSASAQTADQVAAARDILAKVPAAELASRSAQLVADAPIKERAPVAAAVGQAVAKLNPDLASAAVAAISAKAPVVAPAAAAAAAGVAPTAAAAIARAAVGAPGVKLADVRAAVIAAVPARAAEVVSALSRSKTGAGLDRSRSGFLVAAARGGSSDFGDL